MKNLFSENYKKVTPLSYELRPKTLKEYIGQEKIVGEDGILRNIIDKNKMINAIFYGPPGTGKTTLGRILANTLSYHFVSLNATTASVGDLRKTVEEARKRIEYSGKGTILFLDEIHRFNKLQQDALLPYTESGELTLVGATTENPYYNLNNALLSRCVTFEFHLLKDEEVEKIISRGLKFFSVERKIDITLSKEMKETIINLSRGDGRIALNYLEMYQNLYETMDEDKILKFFMERREGFHRKEEKYNMISAFIKSIRGSDPDSAIYWLGRLLHGGEDPKYIARRLVISASEDIGLGNPEGMTIAHNALLSAERIGMPEIRIILAQATIYLAISSKSNSVEKAIDSALADIKGGNLQDVPRHLKNQYSDEYRYPHSYKGNFVDQKYMDEKGVYYTGGDNKNEIMIMEKLDKLWNRRK